METKHTQLKLFKTTVIGIGPWCIEFSDGEIITIRSEQRQTEIARAVNSHAALTAALDRCVEALKALSEFWAYGLDKLAGAKPNKADLQKAEELGRLTRAALDAARKARG